MKFKYDDKTYVVFADIDEIEKNNLLIKVNDNYLDYNRFHGCWDKLDTTQVLKLITKGSKILQAYEAKINHIVVRVEYTSLPDTQLHKLIEHIVEFKCFKNKVLTRFQETYATISSQEEETEEQVKARVSCNNWNSVKYFNL